MAQLGARLNGIQEVASSILAGSTKLIQNPAKLNMKIAQRSGKEFPMKKYRKILIVGIIEILIGITTLLGTLFLLIFSLNTKEPNVIFFVTVAACSSTALGFGIIKTQKWAYYLLLYFASMIIFSKIMIFLNIIHLDSSLVSAVPNWLNHVVSLGYHGWLIYFLKRPKVKELFHI